jgi:hypothetical protein
MFKKIALVLLFALSLNLFTACGNDQPTEAEQAVYEKRIGVIKALGVSISSEGTHRLEVNGMLKALLEPASDQIKLDQFLDQEVEVEGIVTSTAEGNLELIRVVTVTPTSLATGTEESGYKDYVDAQYGFSVRYPGALMAQETRKGVSFLDAGQKVIEIAALDNAAQKDLSQFLIDQYGFSADNLNQVQIRNLSGYQIQIPSGAVVYLSSGTNVFALAWYDNDEANRARNRRYYLELIQSFDLSGSRTDLSSIASEGEYCGGVEKISCASGTTCKLEGDFVDASGICILSQTGGAPATASQVQASVSLPALTAEELSRGWYYGDLQTKKTGTPDIWILVNSGTRAAMWRRPENAPVENKPLLDNPNTTPSALSDKQTQVWNYLKTNLASLVPEKGNWTLIQLAFADPDFVYAVCTEGEKTRRLLFKYTVVTDKVSLESSAYFKSGESQDWLLIEGSDTAFGKTLKIVDARGEVEAEVSEGYSLYENNYNGFTFEYPKNWYWQNPSNERIEFADKPFPAALVRISGRVLPGVDYTFNTLVAVGDGSAIYAKIGNSKTLKLSGATADAEIMQHMAASLKVE